MQTCLCVVVRPGFVSTSPNFMRTSASQPAGPHGRLAQKNAKSRVGDFDTICTAVCNRCASSTTYMLCRLEPTADIVRLQTTQPTSGGDVTVVSSCCANCVEPPRPQHWGPDLPFFGHAGHADPLDGWRCCSQKRVMSRPIQVRQL